MDVTRGSRRSESIPAGWLRSQPALCPGRLAGRPVPYIWDGKSHKMVLEDFSKEGRGRGARGCPRLQLRPPERRGPGATAACPREAPLTWVRDGLRKPQFAELRRTGEGTGGRASAPGAPSGGAPLPPLESERGAPSRTPRFQLPPARAGSHTSPPAPVRDLCWRIFQGREGGDIQGPGSSWARHPDIQGVRATRPVRPAGALPRPRELQGASVIFYLLSWGSV